MTSEHSFKNLELLVTGYGLTSLKDFGIPAVWFALDEIINGHWFSKITYNSSASR
jgi:hypothetical protein